MSEKYKHDIIYEQNDVNFHRANVLYRLVEWFGWMNKWIYYRHRMDKGQAGDILYYHSYRVIALNETNLLLS